MSVVIFWGTACIQRERYFDFRVDVSKQKIIGGSGQWELQARGGEPLQPGKERFQWHALIMNRDPQSIVMNFCGGSLTSRYRQQCLRQSLESHWDQLAIFTTILATVNSRFQFRYFGIGF